MLPLSDSDDLYALIRLINSLTVTSKETQAGLDAVCAAADAVGGIDSSFELSKEIQAAKLAESSVIPSLVLAEAASFALAETGDALRRAVRQGDLQALELHYKYSSELQVAQARLNESYRDYLSLRQQLNRVESLLAGFTDLATGMPAEARSPRDA